MSGYKRKIACLLFIWTGAWWLQCNETLPPRIVPGQVLQITEVVATQGTDAAGNIIVNTLIAGENIYVETFQDTVNVKGVVRIWSDQYPDVRAAISISNGDIIKPTRMRGRVLTIDPGEKFFLQSTWNLITDNGQSLLSWLDYTGPAVNGIIWAVPIKLQIEVELSVFANLGYMRSQPFEFTLEAWKRVMIP